MASVGAVAVALALLVVLGGAEAVLDASSSPAPALPWPETSLSNASVIPFLSTHAQISAFAPGWKPPSQNQHFAPSARVHPPTPSTSPAPGVYKTAPYTCIVVVPGPRPDDVCITRPRGGDSSMPIIKPDLRFIPLHPPEK